MQWVLAIWPLVLLSLQNPACTSGSSWFPNYWSLAWRILNITLLACEMTAIVWWFENSFSLPFFEIEMKMSLFWSYGHCWVFRICWHIECRTLRASSFRIWNSSTGIPSPPLTLFIWCFLRSTWLHIPGCLALGEWSHHRDYLGREDLFCTILLCILATSS